MNENKVQLFHIILIYLFFGIGCTPTNKIVATDDLERQYENSLGKLNRGKLTEKNKEMLIVSLTKIIERESPKRDSLINSENLLEKEKGLAINEYLIKKITNANKYTGSNFKEKLKDLENDGYDLKMILKNQYFTKGKTNLVSGLKEKDKSLTRSAYLAFVKAEKYGIKNAELDSLKKESYNFSTVIYNITAQSSGRKYDVLINDRFKEIEKLERRFKTIYYEKSGLKDVDCNIEVILDELIISNDNQIDSEQFTKKVLEGGGGGPENTAVTRTVRGSVRKDKKIKQAYWDVKINIHSNSNNCDLKSKIFREEFRSESLKVSIHGDERAIPESHKNITEEILPRDNEIAEELIERICKKIEGYFL